MRKILFLCLLAVIMAKEAKTQSHTIWKYSMTSQKDNTWKVQIVGTIESGWDMYAITDTTIGIEKVAVFWIKKGVIIKDEMRNESSLLSKYDSLWQKNTSFYEKKITLDQLVQFDSIPPSTAKIVIRGYVLHEKSKEFLPFEDTVIIQDIHSKANLSTLSTKRPNIDIRHPRADCNREKVTEKKGLWGFIILGFVGGIIAIFTPCVFPMIPLTISVFNKRSTKREKGVVKKGLLYGAFIVLIYLLLSIPFHIWKKINPGFLNTIATNPVVNLIFGVILIIFCLLFFGIFERLLLKLYKIKERIDKKEKGGATLEIKEIRTRSYILLYFKLSGILSLGKISTELEKRKGIEIKGIIFTAALLIVSSFTCTAPILGTLMVSSVGPNGNPWELTAGFFGFSLGLALPFTFLALFPQFIERMRRKNGSWLDDFKKILAYVEFAFALKFFSNADLTKHWGIIKWETFICIWIIIGIGLALYLLFDREVFPAKDKVRLRKIPLWRKISGTVVICFVSYLALGLFNSGSVRLSLVSAYLPPPSYSIFGNKHLKFKYHIKNDYKAALALAKKLGKPLFIDLTGLNCSNCRKVEGSIWTSERVYGVMKNDFVIFSGEVDNLDEMPGTDMSIGEWFKAFEKENFGQLTQPLYAIIDSDEHLMNSPMAYTDDEEEYHDWLICGRTAYENKDEIGMREKSFPPERIYYEKLVFIIRKPVYIRVFFF